VSPERFTLEGGVLGVLARRYTREAGVRQLERSLARLVRKAAVKFAEGKAEKLHVTIDDLANLLGPEPYLGEEGRSTLEPGVAPGLAWTEAGGALLYAESALLPGRNDSH